MAKYRFYVSDQANIHSGKEEIVEIDDEELEDLSEDEKEEYIKEYYEEWMWAVIDSGWELVE